MRLCREDILRWGLVKGASEDQYQPNGVDLRIKEVYYPVSKPFWEKITDDDYVAVSDSSGPGTDEYDQETGIYTLNGAYCVRIAEVIDLRHRPEMGDYGVAGICLPRSSLVRRGCDVASAFWEPGYIGSGVVGLVCHVPLKIRKGDRFCQILFDLAQLPKEVYKGQYQGEGLPA
jgi:deoxycytidine triphosphate deaminase